MHNLRKRIIGVYFPVNVVAYPYCNQPKAAYKGFIPYKMPSNEAMSLESTMATAMIKAIESAVNN